MTMRSGSLETYAPEVISRRRVGPPTCRRAGRQPRSCATVTVCGDGRASGDARSSARARDVVVCGLLCAVFLVCQDHGASDDPDR